MRLSLLVLLIFLSGKMLGQIKIGGLVLDKENNPVVNCNILILNDSTGTTTAGDGRFVLNFSEAGDYQLRISHLEYETQITSLVVKRSDNVPIRLVLKSNNQLLDELEIIGNEVGIDAVNAVRINPKSFQLSPVPFQDISNLISTLPSVTSNNELSTAYSVRGGSYDENLVLVNNIPVYRPFLVRSGQEEGLSFVNTDLIAFVNFSAGGWSAQYDDKMASVLDATYKTPQDFGGSAMASLLGAKVHLEGKMTDKTTFLVGARHKSSAYLLNTLKTEGDYRPRFSDVQAIISTSLSKKSDLEVLFAYAKNDYSVVPSLSTTSFGTFNQELRLQVAFDGRQQMQYQTIQGAINFKHRFSNSLSSRTIVSLSSYGELENIDLEGGYRLCDVDKNISSNTFNECVSIRGIGTLYSYARNRLDATIIDAESSLNYLMSSSQRINAGIGFSSQGFDDTINEYELIDSAGYVTVTESILATNSTNANLIKAYAQHIIDFNPLSLTYGIRANYNFLNDYLLISPRLLFGYQPAGNDNVKYNLGIGLYGQQPFYKEFRKTDGNIKTDIKGQSSLHVNLGMDYTILWWGRPFQLTTELYYKYLWNQIPYIIENVRQQYFPEYTARAKSMGFEARLGGEFIPGTESWFSLGIMSAQERIPGIDANYIRRPTDQRFKVAVVFEDHIPGDPSLRVNLGFQYGSGLPISPPNSLEYRNSFDGDDYSRLDIGFSKVFTFNEKFLKMFRIGVEINNLLGTRNAVSYTWIKDVNDQQFAVPNYLTGRLFNVVLSTEF